MVDRRRRPHRTPNKLYHRVRKLMEVRSACGCTPRVKCGALAGFSAYISRHRLALALEKIQWTCYQDTTQLYYLHGGAWSQLGGVICGSYTCVTCVACVTCRLQQRSCRYYRGIVLSMRIPCCGCSSIRCASHNCYAVRTTGPLKVRQQCFTWCCPACSLYDLISE